MIFNKTKDSNQPESFNTAQNKKFHLAKKHYLSFRSLSHRRQFASVIVACAVISVLVTVGGSAADKSLAKIEAESMTPDRLSGLPSYDAKASGMWTYALWSNMGLGTSSVKLSQDATKVVFRAKANRCEGNPKLQLFVDGKSLGKMSVWTDDYQDYTLNTNISKGTHRLRVEFINDHYGRKCDRNLFIDKITIKGKQITITPPATTPTPAPTPSVPTPTPTTPTPTTPKPTTPPVTPTPTPATPMSTSKLQWAPPVLSGATTIAIPTGSGMFSQTLDTSKDYVLKMPAVARGPVTIKGGRNVVIIGGQISVTTTSTRALYVNGNNGTVHIEGMLITGTSGVEYDAVAINSPNSIVQLQNMRTPNVRGSVNKNNGYAGWHGDIVQPWGGVKELRIDKLTGSTNYQGLFLRPDLGAIGKIDIKRVDLGFDNVNVDGGGHLVWLTTGETQTAGSVAIEEVYVSSFKTGRDIGASVWPQVGGSGAVKKADGSVYWPNLSAVSGSVKPGTPSGGSFVPNGAAGVSYVSPGYK